MKLGLREILTLLCVLGLLVGSYFVGFKRLSDQREVLQADIDSKRATLEQLRLTNATMSTIETQLDDLNSTLHVFETRLPREKDVQQILGDLTRLAVSSNLTITTVKPLKIERTPSGVEQPIEVGFSGGFQSFYSFVSSLEKLDRITRVKAMQLKKMDELNGNMEARLTLSIFFAPDSLTSMK
ncbi:MAG TPA: type 4a pilus biogenesis protein PilO [Tepidisphaeraceae bacterium]|nr:type 4a pilus biogenesis protein PilO [Tepidisphaeraceae bacterium]